MRRAAATAAAVLVLAGCGGPSLSADERAKLRGRIADAREAAGARDARGVSSTMTRLRRDVRALQADGKIGDAAAARLLAEALQTSRRARAELTPEPAARAPTPAPAAPAAPPGKAKGKGKKGEEGDGGD